MKRKSESTHTEGTIKKDVRSDEADTDPGESSSLNPKTSKKIQKKIDMKNALLEFKMQNQKDKEKHCPSCGANTHARSSSSLCPYKKVKELSCEPDEKSESFVIKTSLKNICNDHLFVQNVIRVVDYTNKIMYVGSLFVNFLFIKMLNNGLAIPVIEQSLFASIFALITGNGKKAPEYLVQYFNTFCDLTTLDFEQFKSIGYSSLLNIVAKQYETLTRNYVHDNYEKRSVWYLFNAMSDANSEYYCKQLTVSSRKALAYYIYRKKEGSNPQWPQSIPDTKQYIDITDKLFSLWSTFQPDKCDFQSLYAEPHLFFKWLHFLSEEVHKKVHIMESTSSKVASKGYVYRKLKEIPCAKALNRKSFKSLQEQTLQSINSNRAFEPGKKLAKLNQNEISTIQVFIDTVKARISDGTFRPTKYTDFRGYRFFTLAPIYTVQNKSIQIDAQAFWKLVRESNIPGYKPEKKSESDLTDAYHKLFKFKKLGFRSRESLSTGKKRFNNVITTDGYSACFLFTRFVKKKKTNPIQKNPTDYLESIQNGSQIWAIDPGIRDIFTAVDPSGRQRKISLNEYYHLCGFNNASNRRKKHQNEYPELYSKISDISSLKTTNESDYINACIERLALYDEAKDFYDKDNWSSKLKFKLYVRKQKALVEICKRLIYGSTKYSQKSKTGVKILANKKEKYQAPPPTDTTSMPSKVILAFGDGVFSENLRGNKSAPVKCIKKALTNYYDKIEICMIDEYLTSQICNKCLVRNLENVVSTANSKRRVHAVLKCQETTCNITWNRDVMAANNILDLFLHAANNDNNRLVAFKRPVIVPV